IGHGYSYLDIDDDYIHKIYPLIADKGAVKPDYFSKKTNFMGAHISITYPEENVNIPDHEAGKIINFETEKLFTAILLDKRYYALKIKAPDLLELRKKYSLTNKLKLKNYWVEPHITIAVQKIKE